MMLIREIYHTLTLADKILIAVLTALSVASFFLVGYAAQAGANALITVAGQPPTRKSLQHDDLFILEGAAGRALIEISDGSILIRDSACPQKLCVRQGRIRRVGEIIVCVPNKITIWIEGRRPNPFDAVTG